MDPVGALMFVINANDFTISLAKYHSLIAKRLKHISN